MENGSNMTSETLASRVAVVTGGNHGIGAATACALAARGARVLVSYLRLQDPADAAIRQTYRVNRAQDALHVVEAIRATGGDAEALEAICAIQLQPSGSSTRRRLLLDLSRSWSTTPQAAHGIRSALAEPISMVARSNG